MTCGHCAATMTGRKRMYCDRQCASRADWARRRSDPARMTVMRNAPSRRNPKPRHRTCEACGEPKTGSRPFHMQCRPHVASCAVPPTHPSRSTRVPADHPARWYGSTSPVLWFDCDWCERPMVGAPGSTYCSDSCRWAMKAMRRRGRETAAGGTYTWADVIRLFLKFDRCCAYCAVAIDGQPDPDHVIPISRGGRNSVSNLLPACRSCNSEKGARTPDEWAAWRAAKGRAPLPWSIDDPRWAHLALVHPAAA